MNRPGLGSLRPTAVLLRKAMWIVLGVTVALLVVLAAASTANFTSIVLAKATVYVVPQYSISYTGLDPEGRLTPQSSVDVRLTAVVENPSERTLHLQLIGYSGWMRDGPAEAGLNESRRNSDDFLSGTDGDAWYFRVFGQSTEVNLAPVPPRGNQTFTFSFSASAATEPARFAAIRNITDFAVARGGTAASVTWNQYLYIVLIIDNVPEATSPSAPAYLRDMRRVVRELGVNIAG